MTRVTSEYLRENKVELSGVSTTMQRLVAPLDWHQFRCISRHQNPPGANQLAPLIIASVKLEVNFLTPMFFVRLSPEKSVKTIDIMSNTDYDSVKTLLILVQ